MCSFVNFTLILCLLLCSTLCEDHNSDVESRVMGVCSRPNVPPTGYIRLTPKEKIKFPENETLHMLCEDSKYLIPLQTRICHHGEWKGPPARCAKPIAPEVTKLIAFHCDDSLDPVLSMYVNQSSSTNNLPMNSFHFTRLPENVKVSVTGSNCYNWIIGFEEKVELSYVLIDVNFIRLLGIEEKPNVTIEIENRNCQLQHVSAHFIEQYEIFGNYFFCDLNVNVSSFEDERVKSDRIVLRVKTNTTRTMELEAVMVGETIKKTEKGTTKADCGKMGIVRTGVMEQVEVDHINLQCNESFVDTSGIRQKNKFYCDINGLWKGEFPECVPMKTCPKEEIMEGLDSSIMIEQISNVYYVNSTMWYAIDHSWVHYTCINFDSILVGKRERRCFNGKWTNKKPHCTGASTASTAITIIIVILVFLVAVFSLVVYLLIKFHMKKINRKLETAKSEIEANAFNKQLSTDYYTDIGLETIYEDCKEMYNMPVYEIEDRYNTEPRCQQNEPEYLVMTEDRSVDEGEYLPIKGTYNKYANY